MDKLKSRLTPELRETFPKEFYWGASVSSHQVEGGTYNQWTKWELDHAVESAANAQQRWGWFPSWDAIRGQATDPHNYVSGSGTRHYKYYKTDFKILKALGLNSFSFSIEWSRIEPQEGVYNLEALQYYKNYIKELRALGIEPIPTLWHWTIPVWFDDRGGFSKFSNLHHWNRFVEKLADELDWSGLKFVITLNETNTYISMSYLVGEFPHHNKNLIEAAWTYRVLVRAHKNAHRILKTRYPHLKISVAHQINKIVPLRPDNLLDRLNAKAYAYVSNVWFLKRIRKQLDFLGMNYYFTDYRHKFEVFSSSNPSKPLNDLGWYMEPAGIEEALLHAKSRFNLPILITENGVADMSDQYRLWWITETMHAVANARRAGVKVIGYMHWSLLDNFEWQWGWFPKFGLVSVDRTTSKRMVKSSAKVWSQWLKS